MSAERNERIRERILLLIDSEFESDAAFERELSLPDKTVSNWRRGRSASYMKLLPALSESFGVNVGELLDIPISSDSSELSEDEISLLELYRKTGTLPAKTRIALRETLETTINLALTAHTEQKRKGKSAGK
jgi:hypothetical protein